MPPLTLTPKERARQVIRLCAYELRDVPAFVLDHLEIAIAGQIEDALRERKLEDDDDFSVVPKARKR